MVRVNASLFVRRASNLNNNLVKVADAGKGAYQGFKIGSEHNVANEHKRGRKDIELQNIRDAIQANAKIY